MSILERPEGRTLPRLPGGRRLRDGHYIYWWLEILAIIVFYLVYSAIRNANEGGTAEAFTHAKELIRIQEVLGINHEQVLQQWALHFTPLIVACNYFYGSLHFVVTAGVERGGLADRLLAFSHPLRPDSVAGLATTTAVLSNLASNVPAVMVLKSMVPKLAHPETSWLTLAMASTLAGNLTLPGSLASIIVVERAKSRVRISFWDFMKVGAPSAIAGFSSTPCHKS